MANQGTERSYRLVVGADIRTLPIGPEEAFVLSCIDGVNSEEDLASATGMTSEAIARTLHRLAELGAIEFVPETPQMPIGRALAFPKSSSGSYRMESGFEAKATTPSQNPAGAGSVSQKPSAPSQSGQFDLRSGSSLPPSSQGSSSDLESRRRALARKLSQSSMRPPPGSSRSITPDQLSLSDATELAKQQQVAHYIALADEAAQNDLKSAINSLKIASSIAPEDAALAAKIKSLKAHSASEVWRDHADKAEFELYGRRYGEAAHHFEQAALGHPCWRFFERAAYCYLHSGGDLKKASDLAKRAVGLGPEVAKCHFTLAQVYVAANLKECALAELERAHLLDPKHEAIREAIRMVKKS
jgi:hypothetical protein